MRSYSRLTVLNEKVSCREQIARQHIRGRFVQNFSWHISSDHRARCGCCFSYSLRACSRSQFFWRGDARVAPCHPLRHGVIDLDSTLPLSTCC